MFETLYFFLVKDLWSCYTFFILKQIPQISIYSYHLTNFFEIPLEIVYLPRQPRGALIPDLSLAERGNAYEYI